MIFLLAMSLILTAETDAPAYTLEVPGIDLVYLPEYMIPLSEGILTEETGSVACQPNEAGITLIVQYWKDEQEIADRELWIEQKLLGALPPEMLGPSFNPSEPEWSQGSLMAEVPSSRSLGLVTQMDFTMATREGTFGRGRAYGIFRNGYSVMMLAYGSVLQNPQNVLADIVGMAVLTD